MLDLGRRMRGTEIIATAALVALAAALVPSSGWAPITCAAIGVAGFWLLMARIDLARRPEYRSFAAYLLVELTLAGGIVMAHEPRILLVSLLVVPTLLCAAVWPIRGIVLGTAAGAATIVGTVLLVEGSGGHNNLAYLTYPLVLLIAATIAAQAAQGADTTSRVTAVVDKLTGLLNRAALLARAAELTHQAELTREPVATIAGDVDRFKEVNDTHGHARGDSVLVAVADRLSAAAGDAVSVYRFGGDEFVLLVPGADAAQAAELAGRLGAAIRDEPLDGLSLTMSFGACASWPAAPFDFEQQFGMADRALYNAKESGRNQVCTTSGEAETADGRRAEARSGRAQTEAADRTPRRAESAPAVEVATAAGTGADSAAQAGDLRSPSQPSRSRTWLLPDECAREQMLDIADRLGGVRAAIYLVTYAGLVVAGPIYGWWPLLPTFGAAVVCGVIAVWASKRPRPEYGLALAISVIPFGSVGSFVVSHGAPLPALPIFAIAVLSWSPAFPTRPVVLMSLFTAVILVITGFLIDAHAMTANPIALGVPLFVLFVVAMIGSVLGRSATDHRAEAVVDALTGLLTRQALAMRVAELGERAATGHAVSLIMADIDHFKEINDRHGHSMGDAVLREVAYRLRRSLRAFEAAYRVGGEEVVILLPGVSLEEAVDVAGRLRESVRSEPVEGVAVTVSFGVACATAGEGFEYGALLGAADTSLYEAKHAGRDRVCVSDGRTGLEPALPGSAAVSAAA
ncbi:MAG: diguanylate cyclase [Acidobacteriota bacterium]|nr:diguanylate cyclase [Acidobacteriota bacterium]